MGWSRKYHTSRGIRVAEESTPVEESLTAKDVTLLDDPAATEDVTSIPLIDREQISLNRKITPKL